MNNTCDLCGHTAKSSQGAAGHRRLTHGPRVGPEEGTMMAAASEIKSLGDIGGEDLEVLSQEQPARGLSEEQRKDVANIVAATVDVVSVELKSDNRSLRLTVAKLEEGRVTLQEALTEVVAECRALKIDLEASRQEAEALAKYRCTATLPAESRKRVERVVATHKLKVQQVKAGKFTYVNGHWVRNEFVHHHQHRQVRYSE